LAVACCGKCGYCVRGVPGLVCPECGSDLREVGIVPAGGKRRRSRGNRMILWSVLLPVLGVIFSILLLNSVLPFSQTLKINRMIFVQAPYLNATVQVFGTERIWQPVMVRNRPTHPEEIMLFEQQHSSIIEVNLKTGAYSYLKKWGTTIQQNSGFNGKVIADWMLANGINTSDPRARDLCDGVYGAVNEIMQGKAGGFTVLNDKSGVQMGIAHPAFGFVVHDEPHPAVIVGLVVFWIGVWVYGMRRIYVASRKQES
jgi:hypothetical protein